MTTPTPRQAREESQSLLVATLHERRPNKEIEAQIERNRAALAAQPELPEPYAFAITDHNADSIELVHNDSDDLAESLSRTGLTTEPLYTAAQLQQAVEQAQAKREPMTREQMRDIFLANGFTVKEGQDDLKDYVYAAGRAIEAHHNIGDKA